ncbi:MAG TPA: hypothetical protein VHZ97_03025 [Pseudonocardiaceae bacterium]|nr:hypothetical protein [Pseudonocardiaceae bacterium]
MSDEFSFEPPADRAMDPALRARLAERVFAGIEAPPAPTRRRGPVFAAAGIVVLAGISAVVATTVGHLNGPSPAGTPAPARNADIARCATAADAIGFHGLDDQSALRSIFSAGGFGRQVAGFRLAGGQAMFCETTATTVTVSQPDQPTTVPPGSPARSLLTSDDGVIAGIVPRGTTGLTVNVDMTRPSQLGPYSSDGTATVSDGMFVFVAKQAISTAAGQVTGEDKALTEDGGALPPGSHPQLTKSAPPLTFDVDRPAPGTPTALLSSCLGQVSTGRHESVLDQASLSAGASSTIHDGVNTSSTTIAYNPTQVVTCSVLTGELPGVGYVSAPRAQLSEQHPLQLVDSMDTGTRDRFEFDGMIAPNVGKITINAPGGTPVDGVIVGPTFTAVVPTAGNEPLADPYAFVATILDTQGKVIYQGPLSGASISS